MAMLTRARAKATNQPIFVDEQWNDAYIHNKDEQIDAMHAERVRDSGSGGWSDHDSESSDDSDGNDDPDADVWRSDDDAHSDSDDSGDDDIMQPTEASVAMTAYAMATASGHCHTQRSSPSHFAGGGLLENVFWTALSVLVVPLFLYAALLKRNATPWPLQSASLCAMLVKVGANVLSLACLACVGYGAVCLESVPTALPALLWRNLEINSSPVDCSVSLVRGWDACWASSRSLETLPPLCVRALAQTAVLAVCALLVCCFHRRWLKALLLLSVGAYAALNGAMEFQTEQRTSVQIFSLDPTFAFANESIFVAIDGQNLAQGGIVAWVPYWGGLQQQRAHKCPKLFPTPLQNGGVLVTFDSVNDYIPCYAAAISPRASRADADAAFRCFEAIRLRVKDQKSVPGWSLQTSAAATAKRDEL